MAYLNRLAAGAGAVFAASCVSLLPETEPANPRYEIAAAAVAQGAPVQWSVSIDDLRSTRIYDTSRIAVAGAFDLAAIKRKAQEASRAFFCARKCWSMASSAARSVCSRSCAWRNMRFRSSSSSGALASSSTR